MPHAEWLGKKLREIRKSKDWTLKELSARSGLSVSTLSKVENHKISLTYDNLIKLAAGLSVDVSVLFAPANSKTRDNRMGVARRGDGTLLATQSYDYYYLCQELSHKAMIPIITAVKARTLEEFGPMLSHAGEEFIFVITGKIEVHTAEHAPVVLRDGEGVYIDSTMPHAYLLAGDEETWILGVCSEPRIGSSVSR